MTLTDGSTRTVKVTGASAKIYMSNASGTRQQICNGNGADSWVFTEYNSSSDGSFKFPSYWGEVWSDATGNSSNYTWMNFETHICEIRGPGNYEIALQMPSASDFSGDKLYLDMYSMHITGGANVTIRLGGDVNTNIKYIIFRTQSTAD